MKNFNTADIADDLHPSLQYIESGYKIYGRNTKFYGQIVTIKCFEDNSLVREMVATEGAGKVLVVDGGGSKRCAMLGDLLTQKAVDNHWRGIVIYGLIRDSEAINGMNIGVRALGTHPLKSIKKGAGETGLELQFSGATITPGDYLYADNDGIIISKHEVEL